MSPIHSFSATDYIPSPTVAQFIAATKAGPVDEMRFLILRGDRGAGKTTGAIYACGELAAQLVTEGFVPPLRVGVVRDTWTNLARTSLVSFEEQQQRGLEIHFLNGRKEALMGTEESPLVHFWFFGLDRPDDADKLQGFQCGVLWLEEVAPAAGIASGIPASVLGIGATSVRQPHVPPRILVTMNPPDKNHWILKVEQHLAERQMSHVRVHHFVMQPREKSAHFLALAKMVEADHPGLAQDWKDAAQAFDRYTDRNRAFLLSIGRPDLVARLVEGAIGEVRLGASVVPNFSRALHVATSSLQIVKGIAIIRGLDAGVNDLHPACTWLQVGPDWINVLGSRVGTNLSFEEFLRQEVWPFEQKYRLFKARAPSAFGPGARAGFHFRTIGDPAMFATDGRSARTAALVFEMLMKEGIEPGPVEWTARRESLYAAFGRKGIGDRMLVQIDPDENALLIEGLAGRFHYPEHRQTGEILADIASAKRVSGIFSHPVDSLGYALAVLFPAYEWAAQQMQARAPSGPVRKPGSWLGM